MRSLPFSADEFFAAIRECYTRRAEEREYNRLAFCLLGVASPSDLIQDTRTTPFNIGRRIELTDFTEAEAMPLALGLGAGSAGVPILLANSGCTQCSLDFRRAEAFRTPAPSSRHAGRVGRWRGRGKTRW